jgi:hypothetical protein
MAVIQQMLDIIPYGVDNEFVKDLKWNLEDASYKPPEQNDQWDRTSATLQKHIPNPIYGWQFEILSIFTTKSIEELKEIFK